MIALAILAAIIASAAWFTRPRPADTYADETGDCHTIPTIIQPRGD